jgi:uncharacterized protein YcbX
MRPDGVVTGLYRYPVKSAAAERLDAAFLDTDGVRGDREWAVLDADGVVVSAKHPRSGAPLLRVHCWFDDASATTWLTIGERSFAAGTADANQALCTALGRGVTLTRPDPSKPYQLRRRWPEPAGLVPSWERQAAPGAEARTPVAGPERWGRFVDYGAVHIVTRAALDRLSAHAGRAVDPVRFRPNLVVDGVDDLGVGECLTVGEVVLRIEIPTPRCVVPGLAQPGVESDLSLLRLLARFDRRQVSTLGPAACFGAYATVVRAGAVHLGAPVEEHE